MRVVEAVLALPPAVGREEQEAEQVAPAPVRRPRREQRVVGEVVEERVHPHEEHGRDEAEPDGEPGARAARARRRPTRRGRARRRSRSARGCGRCRSRDRGRGPASRPCARGCRRYGRAPACGSWHIHVYGGRPPPDHSSGRRSPAPRFSLRTSGAAGRQRGRARQMPGTPSLSWRSAPAVGRRRRDQPMVVTAGTWRTRGVSLRHPRRLRCAQPPATPRTDHRRSGRPPPSPRSRLRPRGLEVVVEVAAAPGHKAAAADQLLAGLTGPALGHIAGGVGQRYRGRAGDERRRAWRP